MIETAAAKIMHIFARLTFSQAAAKNSNILGAPELLVQAAIRAISMVGWLALFTHLFINR